MRLIRKNSKFVMEQMKDGVRLETFTFHAGELLNKHGGKIANVSIQLVAEMSRRGLIKGKPNGLGSILYKLTDKGKEIVGCVK